MAEAETTIGGIHRCIEAGHDVGQRHAEGSLLSATCHDCGSTYHRPDPIAGRPCRHIGWLTGRAQALRLDADHLDLQSINHAHSGTRTQLAERARIYRFAAIELDSLADELGQDGPEPPPDTSWVQIVPVHSREATGR